MKFNRFFLAWGGTLALLCQAMTANALLTSVKSTGMAATATAYPQDTLCAAYNPAGIVEVGNRLDMGLSWAHYYGRSRIRNNVAPIPNVNGSFNAYRASDFFTPDFGVSQTFGCDCQYSLGFILYNRNQAKTSYRKAFPLLGRTRLGLEYVQETLGPVFAWKINDSFNVGLSINYNIQRAKVNGLENFDNPIFSSAPGKVTNRHYSWSNGIGVTLGAQWHIDPCLTVGVAFSPEVHMGRFKKYEGFLAKRGRLNLPQIWIAGIAWRFMPCATIAFDVEHDSWRRIHSLHNTLLHDGVLDKLGTNHGPGFGWRSRTFYRLGVDYALNECWIVRAGWRFAPTPIRRSQTTVNMLTMEPLVEHVLTVGATWQYNECSEISSFFAYGFEKRLSGKHSIPLRFGLGNADLKQSLFALGFSLGVNW